MTRNRLPSRPPRCVATVHSGCDVLRRPTDILGALDSGASLSRHPLLEDYQGLPLLESLIVDLSRTHGPAYSWAYFRNRGSDVEAQDVHRGIAVPFRLMFVVPLAIAVTLPIVALVYALCVNDPKHGWNAPVIVGFAQATGIRHLVFTLPLLLYALLVAICLTWTDVEVRRLQPFVNLVSDDPKCMPAARTLLLDYTDDNVFFAWFKSLTASPTRDVFVTMATSLSIVAFTLQPLAGALFTVHSVWSIEPEGITVTSLAKTGLNPPANFMDLTAFQAASSFASASTLYDIGPGPFVSDSYTVGEFELPNLKNGTVYADRPAIFTQVDCVSPDHMTLTSTQDIPGGTNSSFAAFFGQCNFTVSATSNASTPVTYGLEPATFMDCADGSSALPSQFRPVVFWFYMSAPAPTASLTMCTPRVLAQSVSVILDLGTQTQALNVTVLQDSDSPSDPGSADVGTFAYNGLFFDQESLDSDALARLESIQQQLLNAVFVAAKMNDPTLQSTFINDGFHDLTQGLYVSSFTRGPAHTTERLVRCDTFFSAQTTYLTLVAKSVYFEPDDSSFDVNVGVNVDHLFLVPIAAIMLVAVLFLILILGVCLHTGHRAARQYLTLPPNLGTLGASMRLTAPIIHPELSTEPRVDMARLAPQNVGPEEMGRILNEYYYFLDPRTGQVTAKPRRRVVQEIGSGQASRESRGPDVLSRANEEVPETVPVPAGPTGPQRLRSGVAATRGTTP
ncbi:hypothetical protein C2E23DRAFT_183438 [Lenzites betulinus]|nr:hypothetical protein C2E23DRAFT_183438 [Lenzites betulinus]